MKVKLRDMSNIIMGQSPDSSTYNTEKIGLPFFQGNADFGELNPIAKTWCSAPIKIAYKNYILISVRAPIGALNIAAETCCIGRGLAAFDVNNKMCTQKYLWYLLKAKKNELLSKGTGSTFKAISKNILSEMEFNIPPVREQELCTKVLDVVFCLIRLKKEQLDKLDLLVKSRFIEMFGDQTNPLEWPIVEVQEVADIRVGVVIKPAQYYTEEEDGIKAFRSLNIGPMIIKNNNWVYFSEEGNKKNAKSQLQENDLLIVRSGSPGTACVVTKDYEGCNAVDIIIARPLLSAVNPYYLCAYTNFPHGKRQIEDGTGGAAQQHFNIGKYNKLKLMLPPIELQNKFEEFYSQVDKSKFVVTAKFQ